MDSGRYEELSLKQQEEFEALCSRCGSCCGAFDDPCSNLVKDSSNKYSCKVYSTRLGPQNTVSGSSFTCVPIRVHVEKSTLRPGCSYIKGS